MERNFLQLYRNFRSKIDLGMKEDARAFWQDIDGVRNCDIWEDADEILYIHAVLEDFSGPAADRLFFDFMNFVRYDGMNLYFMERFETERRYHFLTSAAGDGSDGTKMEIRIR
ncbi:MAG: hypothetical protein NC079_10270 [Clostridium sp.]|nr:hypothetical protein [Acetatifactor muris]MCM1526345.1 hypothetical protein [Bacteroides sp.]MCM1563977.1 hypothetical protein [Clostridium sp.]